MDIDLLKTFLEVRRLRNFRLAAENLHVTQAAVSQRIKQLESILDTPLFHREKNNILLTQTGEQLVPYAESILAAWKQAKQEISIAPQADISLSIAAKAGIWELYANHYLQEIHQTHPELIFRTDILNNDIALKRLLNQTLDLAFLYSCPELDELECEAVSSFELVLQSPDLTTLEQALESPYVYVDWGKDMEIMHIHRLGFKQQPRLYTGQHIIARQFLEHSGGSAFLPLTEQRKASRLKVIEDAPRLQRQVYAVWHKKNPHQQTLRDIATSLSQ